MADDLTPRERGVYALLAKFPPPKFPLDAARARAFGVSSTREAYNTAVEALKDYADVWVLAKSRWPKGSEEVIEALVEVLVDTTRAPRALVDKLRKAVGLDPLSQEEIFEEDRRMTEHARGVMATRRAQDEELRAERAKQKPLKVTVIGCGKTKLEGKHRAEDLYTGNLFRAALTYAKRTSDVVFIASAKYGILTLDQEIESYDLTITQLSKAQRDTWGHNAASSILHKLMGYRYELVLLAGHEYSGLISSGIADMTRTSRMTKITVTEPLRGMQVGQRLQWFKANTP